ncbi:MAG TPA: hypothetical protein VMA36_08285 [Candidatus Limnocylindria bacterium]|nr:hypothetical protein [Candidatus Limnocylindria bacterium]
MTAAIVPYGGTSPSRGIVRYLSGGVAVDIRLEKARRGGANVNYAMRLASAEQAVSARLYGMRRDGTEVDLGAMDVAPFSIGQAVIPIGTARRPFEHVYLELVGEDLQLALEAPQARRPTRRGPAVAVLLFAGALAATGGAGLTFALPQPPAFAVPSTATAGTVARIPYTTHGFAATSYVARAGDDPPFAAGPVPQARGEIALALPPEMADKTVTIQLRTAGWYGPLDREASFRVVQPAAVRMLTPVIARVGALSARRERIGDAETVLASYLAVADDGHLSVLDQHGKVVAQAPFSRGGTQRIALPAKVAALPLELRLDVRRGASSASAAVSLPAQGARALPPAVAPVVSTVARPPSVDDAPEAVTSADDVTVSADDPFVVVGAPVGGRTMTLSIRRNLPAMQLRLEDETGTVLDQVNVGATDRTAALHAPAATTTRTYYVTCTYGADGGQEVVVRSVRVAAP